MKKLLVTSVFMLFAMVAALAQTARVQIVHNAPDPTVDVYVNGVNTFDDFAFRTATGFLTLPAGVQLSIGVAPASSTSASDVLFNFDVTFEDGKTYVVTASGLVFDQDTPFTLIADPNAREAAASPTMVDLSVLHGAPDAPAVDVAVRTIGDVVTNLAYGQFTPYLSVQPGDYFLDVKPAGSNTILATYRANLTGAAGQALKVMASGLLGSNTFGLYAVFADGTVAALPLSPTARVQLIHNSPDPAATVVDVYKNGNLYADNVPFRGAKAFDFVPAGSPMNIGIAPANSTSVNDTIKNFTYTFENGKTYVVSVIGLTSSTSTPLALNINDLGRETASTPTQVDLAVLHGSPDAPAVDVDAVYVANNLISNLAYGSSTGYLSVAPAIYDLAVRASGNPDVVATFRADLSSLAGGAAYVFASGLLGGTPAFGLYAALADGTVIALPAAPAPARVQVVHNAVAPTVDVYVGNTLLADDFEFRSATPFVSVAADRPLNVGIALANSASAADALANIPVTFQSGQTYVVFASGIFAGNPGFELLAFPGRESGTLPLLTDVAVLHGAPDAPAVDVDAVYVADDLIDNLAYRSATDYTSLPIGVYDLAVRAHDNPAVLATFRADLSGAGGGAAYVFASGLLGGTPAFGLYAVFPDGTVAALPTSPKARVQVIHNSPSPTVDVYLGNTRLIDNFEFRTATPFVDVLADRNINIGIALSNSTSAADAIATFPVSLPEGSTSVVYASGIVGQSPAFTLIPVAGKEGATDPDNVEVNVFHGSPDAPAVDVDAVYAADDLIDNLAYGNATGYVTLAPGVYDLAIRAHDDPNVVATFRADISGLAGGAAQVFASGLLGGTPAFGLYAAFPNGTVAALPLSPTARVQVIHNSPSPTVDVYLGNTRLIDNFEFRTATPFVDVLADRNINIGIALDNSTSAADAIATFPVSLPEGSTTVVYASGIVGQSPAFTLIPVAGQEAAVDPESIEVNVFHGSPDAPAVDVDAVLIANDLIDNLAYGNATGYVALAPAAYDLAIRAHDDPNVVATFRAELNDTEGIAAQVFASGLLGGTPAFGLYVALPDGTVFPLALSPAPARVQVIHNAIAPTVDVYADNTLLIDNFEFRTATPFVNVPAERPINIGVAAGNSTSAEDALANFPLNLESGRAYVVVAGGVLAGSPGFNLFINEDAREVAVNPANVEFAVFHGSPDAGQVDIRLSNGPTLVEDLAFGDFTDYLSVPPAEYFVDVTPADDTNNPFAEYRADLNGTAGVAATLFASGFRSGATPAFEVWAALANGVTFPLEQAVNSNELENTLNDLQLAPNPVKDRLRVQFDLSTVENLRYAVRDIAGRLLMEGDMGNVSGSFNVELNTGELLSGMYQLEIRSDAGVKTAKFIVQN
ncbi:MAG: DUF4397 domain-containing protein [Saprospiraceae bacterium]|nr:DUF4397 domain-containing protein [Saprospiraceae bacterium]